MGNLASSALERLHMLDMLLLLLLAAGCLTDFIRYLLDDIDVLLVFLLEVR